MKVLYAASRKGISNKATIKTPKCKIVSLLYRYTKVKYYHFHELAL